MLILTLRYTYDTICAAAIIIRCWCTYAYYSMLYVFEMWIRYDPKSEKGLSGSWSRSRSRYDSINIIIMTMLLYHTNIKDWWWWLYWWFQWIWFWLWKGRPASKQQEKNMKDKEEGSRRSNHDDDDDDDDELSTRVVKSLLRNKLPGDGEKVAMEMVMVMEVATMTWQDRTEVEVTVPKSEREMRRQLTPEALFFHNRKRRRSRNLFLPSWKEQHQASLSLSLTAQHSTAQRYCSIPLRTEAAVSPSHLGRHGK